jgi:hypothetical protein
MMDKNDASLMENSMKKFLTTFAGIAAAFASNASSVQAPVTVATPTTDAHKISSPQQTILGENLKFVDTKGDQFNFVLKKSEDTGQMMAWHNSHSSHASHSSHSSHYSSR